MVNDELGGYPGRGLLVGRCHDGGAFVAYFITGRSDASRSRTVVRLRSGDIAVVPTEGSTDDPLRHYVAITTVGGRYFVGNGDHVEDVSRDADDEADVFARFRAHSYEPDPPILTPRILAVMDAESNWVGIGTARHGARTDCEHVWFETRALSAGDALAVRTYQGDVHEPRSHGDPSWADSGETVEDAIQRLWARLDAELRVVVVGMDLRTGAAVALDRQDSARARPLEK